MSSTRQFIPFLILAVLLSGCLSGNRTQTYRAAVIIQEEPYEFWTSIKQGIESAGKEFGVEFVQPPVSIGLADEKKQIEAIKLAVKDKVDAILLAPFVSAEMERWVDEAVRAEIPVVTIHSQFANRTGVASVTEDYERTAELVADALSQAKGGELVIVNSASSDKSLAARQRAIVDRLKAMKRFAILDTLTTTGDKLQVMAQTEALLKEREGLTVILGNCDSCAVGAALAVRNLGLQDEVAVIGFDSSESEIRLLEEELIDAIIVQNPFAMGYVSVKTMIDVVQRRGMEDASVYTQPLMVTKEGLQQPELQKLLYPFE
jgi:ABC-type sugar transport system, periplasmic component